MHISISISSVLISMVLRGALAAPVAQESDVDTILPQPTVVGIINGRAIAARQEDDTGDLFPQPTVLAAPVKRQGAGGAESDNGDLDNTINQVSAINGILKRRAIVVRQEGSVIVTESVAPTAEPSAIVTEPVAPTAEPSEGVTVTESEATSSQTAGVGSTKIRARQNDDGDGIGEGVGSGEDPTDIPTEILPVPEPVPGDGPGEGVSQGGSSGNIKKRAVVARQASVNRQRQ